ncbi:hypothetical protein GCM10010238_15230 [Streptomyces griseoviridis]|uniref:Uncharacterized protein n=1 Tax=Streptomyces griseoviridis TaxID=45398 RepID=A0A918GBI2_STRGD|nr:hypothetical protein GCM10010238_15230 [Streptomyces niveoruber]
MASGIRARATTRPARTSVRSTLGEASQSGLDREVRMPSFLERGRPVCRRRSGIIADREDRCEDRCGTSTLPLREGRVYEEWARR